MLDQETGIEVRQLRPDGKSTRIDGGPRRRVLPCRPIIVGCPRRDCRTIFRALATGRKLE